MKLNNLPEINSQENLPSLRNLSRRNFFKLAGGVAGAGILMESCRRSPDNNVKMGTGDTGLLNYMYVVAQTLAGFYTQANATPYYGLNASEQQLLADLRDHQYAYKGMFQKFLGKNAISNITLQLAQVTFADRTSTLTHAAILQDLAVGAYTGCAQLFSDSTYIPLLTKIVSVEGRHAQYVREALHYNSFGDNLAIDVNGLGQVLSPHTVLPLLETYIQSTFDSNTIPYF